MKIGVIQMKEIYNIIQELRANNSSKYKQEVLEKHKDNEKLKKFLQYCYNPRWNYFMKQLPESELFRHFVTDMEEDFFYIPLDKLRNRSITGNSAKDMFSEHLSLCGGALYELYELVIARDIKCNVSVKTINKVWKNLIPEIPYQRCNTKAKGDIDKIFETGTAYVQKKADGIFSYIIKQEDKINCVTRNGTEWESDTLTNVMEHFPNGLVLVGEALIKEDERELDRKTGNGLINSFIKRFDTLDSLQEKIEKASEKASVKLEDKLADNIAEWHLTAQRLHFEVWDILSVEEFEQGFSLKPYHTRFNELKYLVGKTNVMPYISVVENYVVDNISEAHEIAHQYIEQGMEGAILKSPDVLWENKTSKVMVKIKAEKDCDLLCIDVQEGEGRYQGMIGSLICQSDDGKLKVNVGTGLTDRDRQKDKSEYIGKIITVKYNERIDSKNKDSFSLFLPVFVEVRLDKTEADSLERIE